MKHWLENISIVLLCLSVIILIALQNHFTGWLFFIAGLLLLTFKRQNSAINLFLLYFCLAVLTFTPITTDLSTRHFLQMGFSLGLVIVLPSIIFRYIYKEQLFLFNFKFNKIGNKTEILYIVIMTIIVYFLLPFYLVNTGSYHNWTVKADVNSLSRLLIGTIFLGFWDELFFRGTVLKILQKNLPFRYANLIQAVLFTAFLYKLGFQGWGFMIIFLFAIFQGYFFKKTGSLIYIISIHLVVDIILYLALIHSYYPAWISIFLK